LKLNKVVEISDSIQFSLTGIYIMNKTGALGVSGRLGERDVDRIGHELYRCVKKDQLIKAKFIMKSMTLEDRRRSLSMTFNGNTPLFVACYKGKVHFVNYFLDECGADIEQRGVYVVAEDHGAKTCHQVTPLWCAAVANHIEVLKSLLKHGANVNEASDTESTPVRSSCYMTNIDVVKLLVENGADIHKPNINGGTCLINSVQSVELCRYLIERKANVNAQDNSQYSALHYAIKEEQIDTVRLLIRHGADIFMKNNMGDDAYRTAALRGLSEVLSILMEHQWPSIPRQIECHELLGANFVDEKNNLPGAANEWRTAMNMRRENNMELTPDDILPPQAAYNRLQEVTTVEGLNEIESALDRMCIQSLLVRERVLGGDHRDLMCHIMYRGAVYADNHQYQRCVDLWIHAYNMSRGKLTRGGLHDEGLYPLKALCKLFIEIDEESKGGFTNESVRFVDVMPVFESLCDDVEALFEKRAGNPQKNAQDDLRTLVLLVLQFIHLIENILSDNQEIMAFRRRVHCLLKKGIRINDGRSLLHLAMDRKSSNIGEFFSTFPNASVIALLIRCGADVNAADEKGNMPLHCCSRLAAKPNQDEAEKALVQQTVALLFSRGAHMDARNHKGELAAEGIASMDSKYNLMNHITLKCLAARAVRVHNIPFKGEVPVALESFVLYH
jgi:ankyrin repeat protein